MPPAAALLGQDPDYLVAEASAFRVEVRDRQVVTGRVGAIFGRGMERGRNRRPFSRTATLVPTAADRSAHPLMWFAPLPPLPHVLEITAASGTIAVRPGRDATQPSKVAGARSRSSRPETAENWSASTP
jgi:hypothetical protein